MLVRGFLLSCAVAIFSFPAIITASETVPHIEDTVVIYFLSEVPAPSALEDIQLPPTFKRVDELPDYPSEPVIDYSLSEDFAGSWPIPSPDTYEWFAQGIDAETSGRLQQSASALIVEVAYALQDAAEAQQAINRWIHQIASSYDGIIFDSSTLQLFDPVNWHVSRVSGWVDNTPVTSDHVMVHVYQQEDSIRAITRGMKKFALPDLVVSDFDAAHANTVVRLLYLAAQTLVERGGLGIGPDTENSLELDIHLLSATPLKRDLLDAKSENALGRYKMTVGSVERLDGDPANAIIGLLLDEGVGQTPADRKLEILNTVFGVNSATDQ